MNAHINRDLAFVLAGTGLIHADGSSSKTDYDAVEEWLFNAVAPLMAEFAARFDPTIDDTSDPLGLGNWSLFQVVSAWRENAWRNAEPARLGAHAGCPGARRCHDRVRGQHRRADPAARPGVHTAAHHVRLPRSLLRGAQGRHLAGRLRLRRRVAVGVRLLVSRWFAPDPSAETARRRSGVGRHDGEVVARRRHGDDLGGRARAVDVVDLPAWTGVPAVRSSESQAETSPGRRKPWKFESPQAYAGGSSPATSERSAAASPW